MRNRLRGLMILAVAFALGTAIVPFVARTIVGQAGRGAAPAPTPAPAARGAAPTAPVQAAPAYRAPRTKDNKPDFNGIWQAVNTANWNLEDHPAVPGLPQSGAIGAVPPGQGVVEGNEIPYQPAAAANPPNAESGTQPGANATPAAGPKTQSEVAPVSPTITPVAKPTEKPLPPEGGQP